MLVPVNSASDPRLTDFIGLRDAQLRRPAGRFIAEGTKIIERAVVAGCRPRSLLLQRRWLDEVTELLKHWPEVPVYLAEEQLIEHVSGFHVHRGALGSFDRPPEASWETISQARRVLVCEEIVDHANLGAMVRVAAALGWDAVVLSAGSADPLYRRAIKASMGASLQLPWLRLSADQGPQLLREAGFTVVAASLGAAAVDVGSYRPPQRVALLLGTEGAGLSQEWLAQSEVQVTIPMAPGVDSLNVATAAAVLAYVLR